MKTYSFAKGVAGVLCAAVVFAAGVAFGADVFLKPLGSGETRATEDGTSWATAYSTVASAVAGANSGDTIRAAKGVYVISAKITVGKALSIYGGYPGVDGDDPLAGRDIAAYPTILTGDQTQDDVWQRVKPVLGELRFDIEDTETRVLTAAGAVSDPGAFTDKFDGFAAKTVGTNTDGAFTVSTTAFELNGLTMTGFIGTSQGCILKCTPAANIPYTFTDCVFTGNRSTQAMFAFNGIGGNQISFTRCTFSHNYSSTTTDNTANIVWGTSGYTFRSCTFLSCILNGSAWGNIAMYRAGSVQMYDSTFTRCNMIRPAGTSVLAGEGNVIAPWVDNQTCPTTISNCFFTLCYTGTARAGSGVPLVCVARATPGPNGLNHNVFFDNRVESNPTADSTTSLFNSRSGNVGFENCAFVSNTVAAVTPSGDSGKYLLATIGFATASIRPQVVNTTFDSNRILAPSSALTAVKCRGVGASGFASTESGRVGIGYCTFYGPDESDVYDMAQAGPYYPYEFQVVNTIVMSAAPRANAFYADNPQKFRLSNVTIKNHVQIEGMRYYTGLETDEIPLVRSAGPIVPGTMPHFTPAARAPNIQTCDYFQIGDPGYYIFKSALSDEAYLGWTLLLPNCSWRVAKTGYLAYDAVGNARSQTDTMRGAVNAYANGAGEKLSLIVRCDPVDSGALSPAGGIRAVEPNGSVSVTAVPNAGSSFVGWYTTDDEPYGTSPTDPNLTIASLDADLTLVAKFQSADVDLTFDLNGAGTFAGGKGTVTIQAQPGAAFPSVPAYTESDDWLVTGWTPALPAFVPKAAATYVATKVTKALRIIKCVPSDEAGEVQDGTTWATAYGSLAAAVADAGIYRGEVWLKKGVHRQTDSVTLKSNVTLRGGFAGESENETPDPQANLTVVSGDKNGDNKWTNGSTDYVWQDGVFNAPQLTSEAWYPSGNNGDDVGTCFTTPQAATNVVFSGLTFTGFKNTVLYSYETKCNDLLVTNCAFLANGTGNTNTDYPLDVGGSRFRISSSRFVGNYHCLRVSSSAQVEMADTWFEGNSSKYGGAVVYCAGKATLSVTNCDFVAGWAYGDSWRCGPAISCYSGNSSVTVDNCRFLRNQVREGAMGVVVPFDGDTVRITRSRFVGNNGVQTFANQPRYGGIFGQHNGTLFVKDCEISANTNRLEATSGNPCAGICAGNGTMTFVNTTFDGNVHRVTGATEPVNAPFVNNGGRLSFVNCIVNGTAIDGNRPEVKVTGGHLAVLNTALENATAGYVPVAATDAGSTFLSHSFIRNFDVAAVAVGSYGAITNVASSGATRLSRIKQVDACGNTQRGVVPLDRGRDVWLVGTDPYFYDTVANKSKPWRKANALETSAASVTGLTLDTPLIPDALGAARRKNHVNLGPINVKKGFIVYVR